MLSVNPESNSYNIPNLANIPSIFLFSSFWSLLLFHFILSSIPVIIQNNFLSWCTSASDPYSLIPGSGFSIKTETRPWVTDENFKIILLRLPIWPSKLLERPPAHHMKLLRTEDISGTWYVSTGKARVLVFSPPGFRDLVKESSPQQLPTSLTSLHFACSPAEV